MKIDCLDKGYVRYIDHMGSDLSVTGAARASFDRASDEWNDREERLLKFLVREGHMSCFRHASVTVEMYAPLMVARQIWKYAVASSHLDDQNGHNESSRRYITEAVEFYLPGPGEWREAPANKKQGSGDFFEPDLGSTYTELLGEYQARGEHLYNTLINDGVAAEQARLFLPAYGLMVRWRWTFSLAAGLHFLRERLAHDAQLEVQQYALAVKDILAVHFPKSVEATLEEL